MSSESPQGGYKLILVPADLTWERAGETFVAARHGGDTRTIIGPFEVIADVGPDRKIRMSRVFFEEQVEVIG